MSWNQTRFSRWEVEGEVRQRVGNALAEVEYDRLANQARRARNRRLRLRALAFFKAGLDQIRALRQAHARKESGAQRQKKDRLAEQGSL